MVFKTSCFVLSVNQKQTVDNYGAVLEEMLENCTCPICHETYSTRGPLVPKLLPSCGHTVCVGCATQLCSELGESPPCCPLCRTRLTAPKGDASRLPNNVDALRSLNLMMEIRKMSCRRHAGLIEDIFCLSCMSVLCAKCFSDSHVQHEVTSADVAAEHFRHQLDKEVEVAGTLIGHLTRAAAAVKVFEDRTSEVQRRVLEEERAKMNLLESDTAKIVGQLSDRLNPIKEKVEGARKSGTELIRRCRTIANNPRLLLRQFPAVRAELERLRRETDGINVEEIEDQQVDFIPLFLTDWIPLDTVNLVGKLTEHNDTADPETRSHLQARLERFEHRESALVLELREAKERQRMAEIRHNEFETQYRQQVSRMIERDKQLCHCIDWMQTELARRDEDAKMAACEKTELVRKVAALEQELADASSQSAKLKMEADELKAQIESGQMWRRDLEEQLMTETRWRRNAEDASRQTRHQNEELMTLLEQDRVKAEHQYSDLQGRITTLLKNAKDRTRQEVLAVTLPMESLESQTPINCKPKLMAKKTS